MGFSKMFTGETALKMTEHKEVWWMRYRILLLAAIITVGGFLRFYLLGDFPAGLYPDEAMNGLDALRALDAADFKVFYSTNNGREGLYVNLVALMIQMFGVSAWTIRATSAAAGTLTLFGMAFLAHETGLAFWVKKNKEERIKFAVKLMLLATLLLAISVWHIHFSRIGFRAVLLPLFSTFGFAFLLRGFRLGRQTDIALAGGMFALSFSTYIASRILPIVFAIPFVAAGLRERSRALYRKVGIFIATMLLVLFPLIGYFAAHPADFVGRAGDVSVFQSDNPARALTISTGKTLAMFHIIGDQNWRHGVAGRPALDPIMGALLLVGIGLLLLRLKNMQIAWLIGVWFGAMLLPAAATSEGLPHALRAYGAVIPALLMAAIGGVWLWERFGKRIAKILHTGVISLFIVLMLLFNFHQYFFAWAGNAALDGAFRGDLTRVSDYLSERIEGRNDAVRVLRADEAEMDKDDPMREDIAREIEALREERDYVIVNEPQHVLLDGIPMPSATIRFLTADHPSIVYVGNAAVREIVPQFGKTIVIVTEDPDIDLDASLRAVFPLATRMQQNGFTVYEL